MTYESMITAYANRGVSRRHVLQAAISFLAPFPFAARAQPQRVPIADMHSHCEWGLCEWGQIFC